MRVGASRILSGQLCDRFPRPGWTGRRRRAGSPRDGCRRPSRGLGPSAFPVPERGEGIDEGAAAGSRDRGQDRGVDGNGLNDLGVGWRRPDRGDGGHPDDPRRRSRGARTAVAPRAKRGTLRAESGAWTAAMSLLPMTSTARVACPGKASGRVRRRRPGRWRRPIPPLTGWCDRRDPACRGTRRASRRRGRRSPRRRWRGRSYCGDPAAPVSPRLGAAAPAQPTATPRLGPAAHGRDPAPGRGRAFKPPGWRLAGIPGPRDGVRIAPAGGAMALVRFG